MKKFIAVYFSIFCVFSFISYAEDKGSGKFIFLGFEYNSQNIDSNIFDETRDRETMMKIQMISGVPAYHINYIVPDSLKAFEIVAADELFSVMQNSCPVDGKMALQKILNYLHMEKDLELILMFI